MSEREVRPKTIVRLALFREQPQPLKSKFDGLQTFMVLRPNWSNSARLEWQAVGSSEVFVNERFPTALKRAVKRETGLKGYDFEAVGEYPNGEWLTKLYVALISQEMAAQMIVNFDKNQRAGWFDVGHDGNVRTTEYNENGILVGTSKVAFDHNQMVKDAHAKVRK